MSNDIKVFEDDSILVLNKPAGVESQTLLTSDLIENVNPNWQAIHRLDQRVNGIIIFGKTNESTAVLNNTFANKQVRKFYKAVVSQLPAHKEQTLVHWLLKDGKNNKVKAFNKEVAHSKNAELKYSVLQSSQKYHLLQIQLLTGRFHQIRAQLAAINCPIVGDLKYGFKRSSPDGSIFLQSYKIEFSHPITKEQLNFEIEMPELWKKYGF